MFALLLRVAHSGLVRAISSAPPCKEFSRLKLRQPGPKTLRTPSHMDGVPGLSESEQRRIDESTAIHSRSRQVLRAAFDSSAHGGFEQPPSAMSWGYKKTTSSFFGRWLGHVAPLPQRSTAGRHLQACSRRASGGRRSKGSRSVCQLTDRGIPCISRPSAGRTHGTLCFQLRRRNVPISQFANLLPEPIVHRRPAICDGAGLNSTADQGNARISPIIHL